MSKTIQNKKAIGALTFYESYLNTKLMIKSIHSITLIVVFLLMGTSTAFAQPINDDCSGAIALDVVSERTYATYTNELATGSNVSAPECGQYQGADVWFKIVMPENKIAIDLATTLNPKVVVSIYKNNCNNLEEIKCSKSTPSTDLGVSSRVKLNPNLDDADVEAGDEIYIRVFRFGSTVGGTFDISVYNFQSINVANDKCSQAIELTTEKGSFDFQSFSTVDASATTDLNIPVECVGCDVKDIWFMATVPASGKLNIETNPGTIIPAIVVYKGNCGELEEYAFSKNGMIDTGGEVIIDDLNLAGKNIRIRAISTQVGGEGTFDIAIVEPQQDVCEDAIELADAALVEKYIGYTNQYATVNGTEPTCGVFNGKDIWFLMRVPSNGKLVIDTKVDETYGVKPVLTAYTGSCGNLTQYACDFFGSLDNPFGAKIDINDSDLSNQYIYVRMYAYEDAVGGRFEMSTTQPAALPVDLVAFKSEVINNEEVALYWETASELNNDYFIVEHSTDGKDYTPVTHIKGKGTTSERQTYSFVHDEPFFGENYYRLKQVDFDGQYEYSRVIHGVIKMEESKINVYPNPALATGGISIRWNGDFGKEVVQLSITNSVGRQVVKQSVDIKNQREVYIDFSKLNLDAGHYYLTISDKNALITHQKLNLLKD